jgi:hypothetical protein
MASMVMGGSEQTSGWLRQTRLRFVPLCLRKLRQKEIPEAHAHASQVPEQALLRPPSLASANSLGLPYHGAGE